MSSQAYYMAQFAIIIAVAMVVASVAGADVVGDSFSWGMLLVAVGTMLILNGLVWLWRHHRHGSAHRH